MSTQVTDHPEVGRYEITSDGQPAGYVEYKLDGDDKIAFLHTSIDREFGGQGLGSILVTHALEDARGRHLAVEPYCPFVGKFIHDHGEYLDLVPKADRARFRLPH